ncbi:MAG: hypothetical protein K2L13_02755, partial [Opitutales bacterium]|nr:hypothetical protein [Opitutales bacterium]
DYDENEEMTLELGKFYDGDDLRNVYILLNIFLEIGHMVLCLTLNECNFDEQTRAGLDDICAPYYDENDPKSNFFKELGGIPYKDKVSMDEVYKEFGEPWDGYMQEQMQMLGMFLCQDTLFLNAYGDLPLAIAAHEVWPDIAVYLKPTHKEDIDTSDANRLSAIDKTYSENFKKVKDFLLDVHHNNSEECLFGTFLQNLLHKLDEFETPEELFRISSDKVNEIGERISDEMGIPLTKEVKDVLDDIFLSPIWSDNFKKFFAEVSGMSSEKLDEYLGRYLLLSADEGNREWAKFDANEKRDTSHEMRVEFEDLL